MFGDFLSNIKNKSSRLSDNFKEQSQKLTGNLSSLKTKTNEISDNLITSLKNWTATNDHRYSPVNVNNYDVETNATKLQTFYFSETSPFDEFQHKSEEEYENIVERFIKVITINGNEQEQEDRRNDREEIRRRLAMGSDADEYYGGDRPGRKPSLQARLQSGMNLQICFMNETASDTESPVSDSETPTTAPAKPEFEKKHPTQTKTMPVKSPSVLLNGGAPVLSARSTSNYGLKKMAAVRPSTSKLTLPLQRDMEAAAAASAKREPLTEADFFARQARLQAEARMALAQAKEMAHMQMEVERQRQKKSPITEMVRSSLEKVGIPFPEDRRRVSRQILTEMNVAQLQVIVNDLHTQIEILNESLVKFLMTRDDLHMEQDSMLVDIEDLTRYLGAKEQTLKELNQNNNILPTKPHKINRIGGSLVKK